MDTMIHFFKKYIRTYIIYIYKVQYRTFLESFFKNENNGNNYIQQQKYIY